MEAASELPGSLKWLVSQPSVLKVGHIHHVILHADRLVTLWESSLRDARSAGVSGPRFDQLENLVAFWVRCRESNVADLMLQSRNVLPDCVNIKRDSRELATPGSKSYESLALSLKEFCDQHLSEIERIGAYVEWLALNDPMRPAILFTYAKWGSTRRMERSPPDEFEGETRVPGRATLAQSTEYAMGVRVFDSLIPERFDEAEGANRTLSEFADYWDHLRMSVDEVVTQCALRARLEERMNQTAFWEAFIRDVAISAPVESDLWDAKETAEYWHCNPGVRAAKEIEFVERVASFANAKGGVILVGLTNQLPRTVVGVPDCENRVRMIHQSILSHSSLDSLSFKVVAFDYPVAHGAPATCVAVCIGQTRGPVEVRQVNGTFAYPYRRGPSTVRRTREEIEVEKFQAGISGVNFSFLDHLRESPD